MIRGRRFGNSRISEPYKQLTKRLVYEKIDVDPLEYISEKMDENLFTIRKREITLEENFNCLRSAKGKLGRFY